jgi:hypothetical protein
MNKLGFYTEWFGAAGVVDAIIKVNPPTLVSHVTDNDALRRIRGEWSPATFIIGRPFVFPPPEQDWMLDGDSPARQGRELADRILREFPIATERIEGRLVVDAWMALNESVRGPNSFPEGYDHNAPDYREMVRRAAAYDELEEAFQNRLVEQGLQAVAFNFGAGNWVSGEDYLEFFPRVLGSHKYLGFHEYGWPHMDPNQADARSACGIYRQVMQVLRTHGPNDYEVIITEAGLARMYMHGQVHPLDDRPEKDADVGWLYPWDSVAEERYKDSLRWYNRHLLEDDYVKGACLFQVGPGGKWVSFRHTGEDNLGRPLTLMDELFRMSQEPVPVPVGELALAARGAARAAAPPAPSLAETLCTAGQALMVPFNRDATLHRVALQNNMGERLTGEYEEAYDGQAYVAQIYERGLVYAPAGYLERAQVAPTPRTRSMATPSEPRVKSGIHFSNKFWERPSPGDFELLRRARPTCIKTCLFADDPNFNQVELHDQLKAEHPQALIVARLFAGMGDSHWPAQEFVARFKPRIDALQGIVTWFEVHNEPNIDPTQAGYNEGFGATDEDFQVFCSWARNVLNGLRANHPWAKWVFPGNAIHRYYEFWQALMDTIPLFDAWGVHCYWQEDRHVDPTFGRCYERAHALLPDMPIIITECGDSTVGRSPADKIPIYLDWLRHVSRSPTFWA